MPKMKKNVVPGLLSPYGIVLKDTKHVSGLKDTPLVGLCKHDAIANVMTGHFCFMVKKDGQRIPYKMNLTEKYDVTKVFNTPKIELKHIGTGKRYVPVSVTYAADLPKVAWRVRVAERSWGREE